MKKILTILLAVCTVGAFAQSGKKKTTELEIKTSSVCEMCEETIESNLIYEKGVKKVDLDLATSIVHVEYDAKKTTPEAIRTALTKLGYYADDQPGDAKAFAELPACCQKEGCGKKPEEH